MRIAFVHDNFSNEQHGIYNHTYNLYSRFLQSPDIESIHIITPIQRKKSILYRFFPFVLYQLYYLIVDINKQNPEIVHIHGTHLPYSLLPILLKRKYITIITLHGIVALDSKESIRNRLLLKNHIFSFFEKMAVKNASSLIAVSPAIKNIIMDMYSPNCSIEIIPNGVNLKEFELPRSEIELIHPCILFVGRLVKTKNVRILIKALKCVQTKFSNIHLYIAGSGPQMSNLKKMVSKNELEDNVTFLGYIFGAEKITYYKSVDVCVVPSNFESFSIVALESMAASKPVIASNVGGIPYLIEDDFNGFLFSPSDYMDLSNKLSLLLENAYLREEMGKAGHNKAQSFDWDIIVAKTLDHYKLLIGCE